MSDIDAQKPALTIDLIAPEGNVYALIGKACVTLERVGQFKQAKELRDWFYALPHQRSGVTYDDVRRRVEQYCNVTWLNESTPPKVELE